MICLISTTSFATAEKRVKLNRLLTMHLFSFRTSLIAIHKSNDIRVDTYN